MKNIIKNIIKIRILKGYTYENMANDLNITPAAYRKIEKGETKLTVERLLKISKILDTEYSYFFESNNNNHQKQINIYHQENKDIYKELIKTKDSLIDKLTEEINFLKNKKDNTSN